jgi:hypothetical protein
MIGKFENRARRNVMEAIREQLEKPLVAGIVGFVIGLILGWFIIGWGIWPVKWTDAAPSDLRVDAQEDYLRIAIDSYTLTNDASAAQKAWSELGEAAPELLAKIQQEPGSQDPTAIQNFANIVTAAAPAEEGAETASEGGGSSSKNLLYLMCLITLVLGGALGAYFLFRQTRSGGPVSPAVQAQEITNQAERTDFAALGMMPPMSQFMTTYMLGDDLFDDSFSIDSPAGEFLGECGVGISDSIGVGEPKKVAAFEIWLFDKNDIQTVTKVMMSKHTFDDIGTRQRLEAKGEPFLAEPGAEMELGTATLRLVARVVDMNYGSGALPPNSFFERVTLELAIWQINSGNE